MTECSEEERNLSLNEIFTRSRHTGYNPSDLYNKPVGWGPDDPAFLFHIILFSVSFLILNLMLAFCPIVRIIISINLAQDCNG